MRIRKAVHAESKLQTKLLKELTPLLHPDVRVIAIPNGGFRLFSEAVRMKGEGIKAGATDLVFMAPKGVTGWLEVKTENKRSVLSDEQKGFRASCLRNGHLWGMCRTVEEGIAQVRAWGFLREGK